MPTTTPVAAPAGTSRAFSRSASGLIRVAGSWDVFIFNVGLVSVGIAIAFGEKVHDEHGIVDLQAVANRRAHVQNALAVGDQLEAALGGITELAKCVNRDRNERVRQSYHVPVISSHVTQMIS